MINVETTDFVNSDFVIVQMSVSKGEWEKIQQSEEWKKVLNGTVSEATKTIESERIANLSELEQLIRDARMDIIHLKQTMKNDNKEASTHLIEQLDLKLHSMEAFDFVLERRTINLQ